MEIQSTISFLVGSILFSFGVVVISCMIVAVNNIFSKFWKPIKWQLYQPVEYRFIDPDTMEQVLPNKNANTTRTSKSGSKTIK
jgi:hypothetical protein